MTTPPKNPRILTVELAISHLLRVGVVTSLLFVVTGDIVSFTHHPDYSNSPDAFTYLVKSDAQFPHHLSAVYQGVKDFRGQAIVMVGLLLLIATPVMRVAVSIIAFVLQRDWIFVLVTSLVLILLILSFFLGNLRA